MEGKMSKVALGSAAINTLGKRLIVIPRESNPVFVTTSAVHMEDCETDNCLVVVAPQRPRVWFPASCLICLMQGWYTVHCLEDNAVLAVISLLLLAMSELTVTDSHPPPEKVLLPPLRREAPLFRGTFLQESIEVLCNLIHAHNQWTTSPWKNAGLHIIQSRPLCRMCLVNTRHFPNSTYLQLFLQTPSACFQHSQPIYLLKWHLNRKLLWA